jgi:hypothetical protein
MLPTVVSPVSLDSPVVVVPTVVVVDVDTSVVGPGPVLVGSGAVVTSGSEVAGIVIVIVVGDDVDVDVPVSLVAGSVPASVMPLSPPQASKFKHNIAVGSVQRWRVIAVGHDLERGFQASELQ